MPALRFLALVSLALWVGGLTALGVVAAPVLFEVLPLHDPQGQTLAGVAFGAVLESADRVALFLGAIVALTFAWRSTRRPPPRGLVWRSAVLAVMLGATAVTGLVLGPRIDAIRAQTTGAITDLPETDPARITFGRLHGLSGGLMSGTIALGLALMWKEMRDA
jgi:hypothetical protein